MSFAARHNKGSVFDCNTEGFEYFSLKDLYKKNGPDQEYQIQGLYINKKSEYGDSPVAILDDMFVNLPQHLLDECQDMLKSSEDIEDIKAGKVGFKIEPYESDKKKGKDKTCYSILWVDMA